ncbi:type IV toxin-antitoxin system AbiEi family antitoxin domain-containing protein [Comamonas sp. NoAH]|uniref:type IV toxin-antitoxin system AbiEi family antitoxin domain-containing protein n=1 Tax=Comamonas halotolerans TaxID=3041496 RepID=UPI0024E15100|nr:hypothetical protein [Comamonas sp. NoAH]
MNPLESSPVDTRPKEISTDELAKLMHLNRSEVLILYAKRALPQAIREEDGVFYWDAKELDGFLRSAVFDLNARHKNKTGHTPRTIKNVSWRKVFASHLSSYQIVLSAVAEIAQQAMFATREDIAAAVDLPLQVIDENLKKLHERGLLRRVRPGIYALIEQEDEPRAISLTHLPDGTSKLEFGDVCETLTASERRRLAQLLVGDAVQYSNIQAGHDANLLAQELFLVTNMLRTADSERRAALLKAGVDVPLIPWEGVSPHLERFSQRLSKVGATYSRS